MTIKSLLVCFILMACAAAHADGPRESQKIAITAKPSVVKVWGAYTATVEVLGRRYDVAIGGTGTGWFMTADGYVATNAHVVAAIQNDERVAKMALTEQALDQAGFGGGRYIDPDMLDVVLRDVRVVDLKRRAYVVLPNGDKLDYKIKRYGQPGTGRDCAILKVDTHDAPALPIGDSAQVQVEDRVVVIGYPGVADLHGVLDNDSGARGRRSSTSTISALKTATGGESMLQISAPITHGNSGGPAIDVHGNVIGLVTFTNEREVQGFSFLVASDTLSAMVREVHVEVAASPTSEAWRAGLEHYWHEDYAAAIDSFEQVRALYPAHADAPHMLELARKAKQEGRGHAPASAGAIAGVIAGLVVLGLIVMKMGIWRAMRRPAPPAAQPIAKTVAIALGRLECVRGRLAGQHYPVTPGGIVVGRHPSAQVLVDDPRASGKHVWIGYDQGQLVAVDFGTTNGTFVNDTALGRIQRAPLRDGDVVIVGDADCLCLRVRAAA